MKNTIVFQDVWLRGAIKNSNNGKLQIQKIIRSDAFYFYLLGVWG